MNPIPTCFIGLCLFGWAVACGEESSKPECRSWSDCGERGRSFCLAGACSAPDDGKLGSVNVTLSFGRDDYQIAASGRVHFMHAQLADGTRLTCERVQSDSGTLDDDNLNPLQAEPRYLQFQWTGGGTYFPNNLIQFIHPAEQALVVAEGFSGLNAEGERTALGCVTDVRIASDTVEQVTVSLTRLPGEK